MPCGQPASPPPKKNPPGALVPGGGLGGGGGGGGGREGRLSGREGNLDGDQHRPRAVPAQAGEAPSPRQQPFRRRTHQAQPEARTPPAAPASQRTQGPDCSNNSKPELDCRQGGSKAPSNRAPCCWAGAHDQGRHAPDSAAGRSCRQAEPPCRDQHGDPSSGKQAAPPSVSAGFSPFDGAGLAAADGNG